MNAYRQHLARVRMEETVEVTTRKADTVWARLRGWSGSPSLFRNDVPVIVNATTASCPVSRLTARQRNAVISPHGDPHRIASIKGMNNRRSRAVSKTAALLGASMVVTGDR